MKIPAQVDYEEKGHRPIWPGGEPQSLRDAFNKMLAEEADASEVSPR